MINKIRNEYSRNGRKCHKTLVVRDTENIVNTFKVNQSVTATAIKGGILSTPFFASPTKKICQLRPFLYSLNEFLEISVDLSEGKQPPAGFVQIASECITQPTSVISHNLPISRQN